jgi:hypothetical protein
VERGAVGERAAHGDERAVDARDLGACLDDRGERFVVAVVNHEIHELGIDVKFWGNE